ncbi:MAG: right-handed parallel beta-helix repeat-containing protein [Candidatus Babeliales bacterium]
MLNSKNYFFYITIFVISFSFGIIRPTVKRSFSDFSDEQLKTIIINSFQLLGKSSFEVEEELFKGYKSLSNDFRLVNRDSLLEIAYMMQRSTCAKLTTIFELLCEIQNGLAPQDINGIYTALDQSSEIICEKFQETWTALEAMSTPTVYILFDSGFQDTFTALVGLTDAMCTKFEETWTILAANCGFPIAITGPATIAASGNYCLDQNILGSIIISADNVNLDLNHKRISSGTPHNIEVTSQGNIYIFNGILSDAASSAISITTCTNVTIENVDFIDNPAGISVLTSTIITVNNCTFRGSSGRAMSFDDSMLGNIANCTCELNTGATEILATFSSRCMQFSNIEICNNTGAAVFFPILINNLSDSIFQGVRVNENSAATELGAFVITGTTQNVKFFECTVFRNNAPTLAAALLGANPQDITFNTFNIAGNSFSNNSILVDATALTNGVFNQVHVDDNTSLAALRAFQLTNCSNLVFNGCSALDNTATSTLIGLDFQNCNDGVVKNSSINDNTSSSLSVQGINIYNSHNLTFDSCTALVNTAPNCQGMSVENSTALKTVNSHFMNNVGSDVNGVHAISSCTDLIFNNCTSLNNTATNGVSRGFYMQNSLKVVLDGCLANDNLGSATGRGIDFFDTHTSCIINSFAKINQGTNADGEGIRLENCIDVVCQNNSCLGNTGAIQANGIAVISGQGHTLQGNICNNNTTRGIYIESAPKNTIDGNICNNQNNRFGIELVSSNSNSIKANIANTNVTGISLDSASLGNCVLKNFTLLNTDTGINNLGSSNSFILNNSEHNGISGVNNFNGVPTSIIAIFQVSVSSFVSGTTNPFVNVDIRP